MDTILNDLNFINNLVNIIHINISLFIFALNGLILYVITKKLKLDTIELKFVFLLCVVEIIAGLNYTSLAIFKLINGYNFFAPNNTPCIVYAYISSTCIRFEYVVVSVLALWRYLAVVHEYKLDQKLLVIITIAGISPTVATFLYGLINMDARPISSYVICAPITNPGQISTILNIIGTILLMLPCWLITYCYFFIGWKANKKLNLMKTEAQINNNEVALKAIKIQKINLMLQILMVFVLYNVDVMVTVVTYFMRLTTGYKRPPFFDAITYEMLVFTLALNPIITVSFQPEVKNEIKLVFIKLHAKIKKALRSIAIRE
ncbi:family A G protein-coupled receptor-like protein [Conidiobolus coronatus NRRL 28638]|uniref:Family A G protein-coupled receptor-like protein n=1 Tax=Conidiobolus coronatus (strain ATCC 28846 / CBS 209.66 / NRRL 28638) TaxID=796925 RepID=A0A137PH09_CONC2|nr:family A G protein-coupled receptor-like protein [Conidiobolus coronatus NRRL 28638]|eukprot:KXN74221.1 family A G protein-coupled receptor-like protein [Conidiobolus coronatus NRRL 28638]